MDKSTTTNTANAKAATESNDKNEEIATNDTGCGSSYVKTKSSSTIKTNNNQVCQQRFSTSALLNNTSTSSSSSTIATGTGTEIETGTVNNMMINLDISTTTGGNFSVSVENHISIESLKKIIAKKLKVAKDRICLLHREKELQNGSLRDHNLMDGSKIILIPNVETGLLAQRPENTVMQALESLNDSQVNDFLSGKTPLNLSMRLGDHMMLIQLQLSTVNPAGGTTSLLPATSGSCSSSASSSSSSISSTSKTEVSCSGSSSGNTTYLSHTRARTTSQRAASGRIGNGHVHSHQHPSLKHSHHHHIHKALVAAGNAGSVTQCKLKARRSSSGVGGNRMQSTAAGPSAEHGHSHGDGHGRNHTHHVIKNSDLRSLASNRDHESLQNNVKSIAIKAPRTVAASAAQGKATPATGNSSIEQSPIKSLSNLVSSPIKAATIKNIHVSHGSGTTRAITSSPLIQGTGLSASNSSSPYPSAGGAALYTNDGCQHDPIAAKLTSCLCMRLPTPAPITASAEAPVDAPTPAAAVEVSSANSNIKLGTVSRPSGSGGVADSLLHKTVNNPIANTRSKHRPNHHHHHHHHHHHRFHHAAVAAAATLKPQVPAVPNGETTTTTGSGNSNNSAELSAAGLAEASRNLTQTLRKLSKEVFTNKIDLSGGGNMGVGAGLGGGEETPRKNGSGAVIESMKNHGKGIYSGTFSGTLNPALQDRFGRPKRDISTVIHILNDLLSATPQYSRGARISFESPYSGNKASTTSNSTTSLNSSNGLAAFTAATPTAAGGFHNDVRSKMYSTNHHSCAKCNSRAQLQPAVAPATLSNDTCAYGKCKGHYMAKTGSSSASSGNKSSTLKCCTGVEFSYNAVNVPAPDNSGVSVSSGAGCCICHYVAIIGEDGQLEQKREHMCQKCVVEQANLKTKVKLDQLRLVMQQCKNKREARKLKCSPYSTNVETATSTTEAMAQYSPVSALEATPLQVAKPTLNSTTATTTTTTETTAAEASAAAPPPSEVSPNHIVEEVDTAA